MMHTAVNTKSLIHYSAIALPLAFAGFPLYILAPDFYATQHGLSLAFLGSLLLFIRLFDAVQDPLIGWLVDRLKGNFIKTLSVSAALLCLSIALLFNTVFVHPAFWFAFCMTSAVTAYSMMTVILGTRAILWTDHRDDQTKIASTREAVALIGLILAVTLPTALSQFVEKDYIYWLYSLVLFFLTGLGLFLFSKLPSLQVTSNDSMVTVRYIRGFLDALSPPLRRLYGVYGLSMIASSVPAVLVIFYVRDLLDAEALTGVFMLVYFLSGIIGIPFWKMLSTHIGKSKSWFMSHLLAVAGLIGAFFLGANDIYWYGFVCFVSGLAFGADLTLPPALLSDQINQTDNTRYAGTGYALLSFITKASLALASAAGLFYLDHAGFMPGKPNSANALAALSTAYALIPSLLKLAAAGLLYFFFIRPNQGGNHDTIQNHHHHRSSFHA